MRRTLGWLSERVLARTDRRTRGVTLAAGGMAALATGSKLSGLGLFARGVVDIEDEWRAAHPEFVGGVRERWRLAIEHYEATHQHPTNRKLHLVGIPIIIGGATGLIVWPRYSPPWWLSAGAFGAGWGLNLVGHAVFERNAPAFAEDPLSFVAGPVWDLMNLKSALGGQRAVADA
ncbi:MAG: DUF962 domain-containing protein [Myxococcales bacterium]|nr:DUF962 domain-containing protein [Myxococcales bacterium]